MNGLVAIVLAIVAASAFAFGGVYPWIWWPVIAGSLLAGAAGMSRRPLRIPGGVALAAAAVLAAGALQLLPIPQPILSAVSPALGAAVVAVVGAVADHGQQRPPPHATS